MEIPARLHVLLARSAPHALVIRRGPSRRTAVIGWDRSDDSFVVGQWLKGKIYHYRSDISPDGRHWIYFAMDAKGRTWTAVARTPYLKALDFYPKMDAWNGGGLFATNGSYWINDEGATLHRQERYTSGLAIASTWGGTPNRMGECPGIYFLRLARDGWIRDSTEQAGRWEQTTLFSKRINDHWRLCKLFHAGPEHPVGKSPYYETYLLRHAKTGEEIPLPDAAWAEVDNDRFLWAEGGKIMCGHVGKEGLQARQVLFDANPLRFSERIAPY